MKIIGAIIIGIGLALIIYFFFRFFSRDKDLLSPIPEQKSIKIIYISPAK